MKKAINEPVSVCRGAAQEPSDYTFAIDKLDTATTLADRLLNQLFEVAMLNSEVEAKYESHLGCFLEEGKQWALRKAKDYAIGYFLTAILVSDPTHLRPSDLRRYDEAYNLLNRIEKAEEHHYFESEETK